jgi:addiction module RelE/StbE family toxin
VKGYKVLMTQPAIDDLQSIASYIANELREPSIAINLLNRIKEAVMSLSEMPARHSLVSDENLAIQKIRKILVDNYIVFYTVSEQDVTVTVIRILYGRRDWVSLI